MTILKDKTVINICDDQEDWQVMSLTAFISVQNIFNPYLQICVETMAESEKCVRQRSRCYAKTNIQGAFLIEI